VRTAAAAAVSVIRTHSLLYIHTHTHTPSWRVPPEAFTASSWEACGIEPHPQGVLHVYCGQATRPLCTFPSPSKNTRSTTQLPACSAAGGGNAVHAYSREVDAEVAVMRLAVGERATAVTCGRLHRQHSAVEGAAVGDAVRGRRGALRTHQRRSLCLAACPRCVT
jgi:hypothetical protein